MAAIDTPFPVAHRRPFPAAFARAGTVATRLRRPKVRWPAGSASQTTVPVAPSWASAARIILVCVAL